MKKNFYNILLEKVLQKRGLWGPRLSHGGISPKVLQKRGLWGPRLSHGGSPQKYCFAILFLKVYNQELKLNNDFRYS